jgi:protein-S-isoprenylcysteine O-methyltransferase Ste14
LPAWSLTYWQGWSYWLVFAGACTAITLNLMANDPGLLERRLQAGPGAEAEPTQRAIQAVASVCFIATILAPALDHLLGWSNVPPALSVAADVLVAVGFYGVYLAFRENSFAAATIQVEGDQRVIDRGTLRVGAPPDVRRRRLMMLATPIALGSWWGLIPAVLLVAAVVFRLLDEERFLAFNLPGYAAYMRRTRFRLVPGIW